jgi:hypothetical protein
MSVGFATRPEPSKLTSAALSRSDNVVFQMAKCEITKLLAAALEPGRIGRSARQFRQLASAIGPKMSLMGTGRLVYDKAKRCVAAKFLPKI